MGDQKKTRTRKSKETTSPAAAFQGFLEAHQQERHAVVLQEYPDPDAIASAFAHQIISQEYGIEVDILYSGAISHQQNRALVNLLKIELIPFSQEHDFTVYDGAIFVDNQGSTARELVKVLQKHTVPVLMIIDHHEVQDILQAEFSDIRRIGATATMYSQYIESGLLRMQSGNEEHMKLTTALMHGILTDTSGFLLAGPEDFQAAGFLCRYHDVEILEHVMSQERSKKTMEIISKSLVHRQVAENISISGIGYLKTEDRDAIPQAADFLVSEENVHTAIVYGIVRGKDQEEFLVGSLRTTKITLDPDEFIKEVFGKDSQGQYFGGGKHTAGGFQMSIGFLSGGEGQEYQKVKWQAYDTKIKERIFSKIGYDQEAKTASES